MRILIVGGGGREHAIAWKCAQSPLEPTLFVAPGNAGTAALGENVPIAATDIDSLVAWVQENAIDLTVVAQDDPLALGAVDALQASRPDRFWSHASGGQTGVEQGLVQGLHATARAAHGRRLPSLLSGTTRRLIWSKRPSQSF